MTELNNRLIAEFMGMNLGVPNDNSVMIQMTPQGNEVVPIESMEYHTSWDWLMPVVRKILTNENYIDLTQRENIMDSLPYGIEDDTYAAVVEFIKWYNEQQ